MRRGYEVNVGKPNTVELVFVAQEQNERLYIQVSKEISELETEKRKYERLLGIRDNYPKYVLRTDDFAAGNYEGIKTMHVADFLVIQEYWNQYELYLQINWQARDPKTFGYWFVGQGLTLGDMSIVRNI